MHRKIAALAVTALVASASALQAQSFAYAAGSQRYIISQRTVASQEVMGQKMTDSSTSVQILSLDIVARGKDTLQFTYTIDSLGSSKPEAQAELSKMKGMRVTGAISPLGDVLSFQTPAAGAEGLQGQEFESLRTFLVRLPNGAPKAGTTWSDSTTTKFSNQGIEGARTVVTRSKVLGDTVIGGRKAWRIEQKGTLAMSGAGTQGGQALVLEGTGTMDGVAYVSLDGRYLGTNATHSAQLSVQVPAAGMTVPITQSATTKIELLPAKR